MQRAGHVGDGNGLGAGAREQRRRPLGLDGGRHRDEDEVVAQVDAHVDEQQRALLAAVLQGLHALGDIARRAHRFLIDLDDHVATLQALVGGVGVGIDLGDDHALEPVLDRVALAQLVGHAGEVHAEHLPHGALGLGLAQVVLCIALLTGAAMLLGLMLGFLAGRGLATTQSEELGMVNTLSLMLAGMLTALLLATSLGGTQWAWGSVQSISLYAIGALALVAFVLVEGRAAEPVLPLRLFGSRVFTLSNPTRLVIDVKRP